MGDKSAIEWTDATWNPIRGCSRVSEGCRNCYAERTAIRQAWAKHEEIDMANSPPVLVAEGAYHGLVKSTLAGPRWTGEVRFVEPALALPLSWKKPRRIFVNSMSDLFHEKVADEWIDRIFAVMAWCRHHTFQVLTKRPERMREYSAAMAALDRRARGIRLCRSMYRGHPAEGLVSGSLDRGDLQTSGLDWPLPNVWLGVSVEDQPTADERIDLLLDTPAAVRWVSYEPAIGPVDFKTFQPFCRTPIDPATRRRLKAIWPRGLPANSLNAQWEKMKLDWIVVGGESGPGARPFDLAWARQTIAQGRAAGVPVFCKQLGANVFESTGPEPLGSCPGLHGRGTITMTVERCRPIKLRDRKGGDPAEWPEDLRVREFPKVTA